MRHLAQSHSYYVTSLNSWNARVISGSIVSINLFMQAIFNLKGKVQQACEHSRLSVMSPSFLRVCAETERLWQPCRAIKQTIISHLKRGAITCVVFMFPSVLWKWFGLTSWSTSWPSAKVKSFAGFKRQNVWILNVFLLQVYWSRCRWSVKVSSIQRDPKKKWPLRNPSSGQNVVKCPTTSCRQRPITFNKCPFYYCCPSNILSPPVLVIVVVKRNHFSMSVYIFFKKILSFFMHPCSEQGCISYPAVWPHFRDRSSAWSLPLSKIHGGRRDCGFQLDVCDREKRQTLEEAEQDFDKEFDHTHLSSSSQPPWCSRLHLG